MVSQLCPGTALSFISIFNDYLSISIYIIKEQKPKNFSHRHGSIQVVSDAISTNVLLY